MQGALWGQLGAQGGNNINRLRETYAVETGLDAEDEENPNTQVFVLENIDTNLSEIIKYRRNNNWPWSIGEFEKLVWDLCHALNSLH